MSRFFIIITLLSIACKQPKPDAAQPSAAKIIFDTDMGSDCDDVGALALLHTYADQGKAEILGCTYSSGKVPYGAAIIQAINIYRGRPQIAIGAYHQDDVGDPVDKMSAEKLAKDTFAFGHSIIHNDDAENQTSMLRRLLIQQPDTSVTYLTVGHTKGLYDLLVSQPDKHSPLTGEELIQQKIKKWVALGALGAYNPDQQRRKDWNFFFNGTAPYTEYLVNNFPQKAIFIDGGHTVMTGKSLKNTPKGNIIRTAYRDWLWWHEKRTLDDQRPSWDLVATYYAIEGLGEYLEEAPAGYLDFNAESGCIWRTDSVNANQVFVLQKEGTDSLFAGYLNEMIIGD